MKALILGGGRIGRALMSDPYLAKWDITVVEKDDEDIEEIEQYYDVLIEEGDARDYLLLEKCGIAKMDAVFAVTDSDEANILAGMIAKKKGVDFVAVRLSDAVYGGEYIDFIKSSLGIDLVFNPSKRLAKKLFDRCILDEGAERRKTAVISGGGRTAMYLSQLLIERKYKVTIVSENEEMCRSLIEHVDSKVMIVNGDINDKHVIDELGLPEKGAFIAINRSEAANIMLAKFADSIGVPYTAARATQSEVIKLGKDLGIDLIITPRDIADYVTECMKK